MHPSPRAAGLGWAFAFTWLATRGLPPNPPWVSLAVVTAYLVGHLLVGGVAAYLAYRSTRRAWMPALVLAVLGCAAAWHGRASWPDLVAATAVAVVSAAPAGAALLVVGAVGGLGWRVVDAARTEAPATLPAATVGAPVVLLGMDGLDLDLVDRFAGKGLLPHFARMLAEGSSAPLETVSHKSPVVWTSIATGRPPDVHRVAGYTSAWLAGTPYLLPQDPVDRLGPLTDRLGLRTVGAASAAERRVPAIWEVAAACGRPALVINWWASYPADPVGLVVSNHAIPWARFDADARSEAAANPGAVWPEARRDDVARIVADAIAAQGADARVRDSRTAEGSAFFSTRDDIVLALWRALSDPALPVQLLYTQDVDTASHAFSEAVFGGNWDQVRKPRLPEAERAKLWKTLVIAAYQRQDARLGEVMDHLPPGAGLLVVSDHGWEYNGRSHWARPDGSLLAWGGPFRAKGRVERAHVYDVLPTMAAVAGLPVSGELEGRVRADLLTAGSAPERVPTYGGRLTRAPALATSDDADHVQRLRELGYVE